MGRKACLVLFATVACGARSTLGVPEEPAPVPIGLALGDMSVTGDGFTCILLSDGSVDCFGDGNFCQLGVLDVSRTVVPGIESVQQISASQSAAWALSSDGTVWAWGQNADGDLGIDPNYNDRYLGCISPPRVVSGLSNVRQLAQGCALLHDGAVRCAGPWPSGSVVPLPPNLEEVSFGGGFECGLDMFGKAWCLGSNYAGELGIGSLTPTKTDTPVEVVSPVPLSHIAAGGEHACALDADGGVWCWGRAELVGVGDANHDGIRPLPTRVAGLSGVTQIVTGYQRTYALRNDGSVWRWGPDALEPERVDGLGLAATVAAGPAHACAILRDATVWCWGYLVDDPSSLSGGEHFAATPEQVW